MAVTMAKWPTRLILPLVVLAIFGAGLGIGRLLERYDDEQAFGVESERIAEVLKLAPGKNVGDIRAGAGRWTVAMARRVAPNGHAYATAGPDPTHVLLETVADSGLDNITVITRTPARTTRLPAECCDALLVRAVYHEFEDRVRLLDALAVNLKPGGLVAVIDFDDHTPEAAGGHGIARAMVVSEFKTWGFEVVEEMPTWFGNAYCVVFRRPTSG